MTMIDIIKEALAECNITTYRINERKAESVELFFIKHELDMRRKKEVCTYNVTVFRDFEKDGKKMRGFSATSILKGMSKEKIEQELKDAYYAAGFVCNPYFELNSGDSKELVTVPGSLADYSLEDSAAALTKALFDGEEGSQAFLNSAELFVIKTTVHIINTNGVDCGFVKYIAKGEMIGQCKLSQDVELYDDFSYDGLDTQALTEKVKTLLTTVQSRSIAQPSPKSGTYDVILDGTEIKSLVSFYTKRASTSMIYAKYSKYAVGDAIQGDALEKEKLNITWKANLPYSEEGIPMVDREMMKEGTLMALQGAQRFCYYMGLPGVGYYDSVKLSNGTKSMDELKEKKHLHVVSFSSFEVDSYSGFFGGEIRLAYYFDGEKTIPVTGGSISGSIFDVQKQYEFSTEVYKDSKYEGPAVVLLHGVSLAGSNQD